MDKSTLELLAKYNITTNDMMNGIISTLSVEQWNKPFGGFFASIKEICNHIYGSDFGWLKRFSGLREFYYYKNSIFEKTISFKVITMESIRDYLEKRKELDLIIEKFVNELHDDDLKATLHYSDSRKMPFDRNFGNLVLHMFNHQTHHRGMISIYLEEMNIENDYSNLDDML